jgi:hypothetical protein
VIPKSVSFYAVAPISEARSAGCWQGTVGSFGPAERPEIGVCGFNVSFDECFELAN